MGIQLKNNASGTLATAISASDTGIVLTTGNGASFPALGVGDYFYATLESTGGTFEVIKVTARSGDSMTVVRAQEGSTANSFAAGSRIELRVTGASVTDFLQSGTGAVIRNFRDKLRETVSVMDFGAVGDGVADDQPAIQAALNSGFGVILLPKGTYKLLTPIRMGNNRVLRGEGDSSTLLWAGGAGSVIEAYANAAGTTALANVGLDSFKIDGDGTDNMIGVEWIYSSVQSYARNIFVTNIGDNSKGFRISKTWYADFDTLSVRNGSTAPYKTGSVGFLIDSTISSIAQVNGVVFKNLQVSGCEVSVKIDSSVAYHYSLVFVGGTFESGVYGVQHVAGVAGFGVRSALFLGTYFEDFSNAPIDWQTSTAPLDRTGNVIWDGCSMFSGSVVRIDEGLHWFKGSGIIASLVLQNGGQQQVLTEGAFPVVTGAFASRATYRQGGAPTWTNPGQVFADVRAPLGAAFSSAQTIQPGVQPAIAFLVPAYLAQANAAGTQFKVIVTGVRNYDAVISKITEGYLNKEADTGTWGFQETYNKSSVEWAVTVNASGGVNVKYDAGDSKYATVQFVPV
jgi:hypothetical protein